MMRPPTEFSISSGASESLRSFCTAFEKYGIKSNTSLRKTGYRIANADGSDRADLAGIERFIKAALQKTNKDDGVAEQLFNVYRPSYQYALNNTKKLRKEQGKNVSSSSSSDYVTFAEFRVFTIYICIYASMFDIFSNLYSYIFGGKSRNDDPGIKLDEFLDFASSLGGYNFVALQGISTSEEATDLFRKIDSENRGEILFSEWSNFLAKMEIESNSPFGILLSGKLKPTRRVSDKENRGSLNSNISTPGRNNAMNSDRIGRHKTIPTPSSSVPKKKILNTSVLSTPQTSRSSTPIRRIKASVKQLKVAEAYVTSKYASEELYEFIQTFQPLSAKTNQGANLRRKLFSAFDKSGTGQCSVAAIDSYIQGRLKLGFGMKRSKAIFTKFRAGCIQAFNAANDISKSSANHITFAEFRLFNAYLCIFAGILDIFSSIDSGNDGITARDDRHISETDMVAGYSYFKNCGFISLSKIKSPTNAKIAFAAMDTNKKGNVRFIEFCDYVKTEELRAETALGKLFDIRPSRASSKKTKAIGKKNPVGVSVEYLDGTLEELQELRNSTSTSKRDLKKNNEKPLGVSVSYLNSTLFRQELHDAGIDYTKGKIFHMEPCLEPGVKSHNYGFIRSKGQYEICPRDSKLGASYVDSLNRDYVGPANAMLSYCWSYSIKDVVETLVAKCQSDGLDLNKTFVWICCFCINQHRRVDEADMPVDVFRSTFYDTLNSVKTVWSMITPWDNPVYLERAWCIFELYAANMTNECRGDIIMLPAERETMIQAFIGEKEIKFEPLLEALEKIDIKKAETSHKKDKENILNALLEDNIESSSFNTTVIKVIRDWLKNEIMKEGMRIESRSDDSSKDMNYASFCIQAGNILKLLDCFEASRQSYRKSLSIYKKVLDKNHPMLATCYNNIANVYKEEDNNDQALGCYTKALSIRKNVLGSNHPSLITSYNSIANLYKEKGDHDQALKYYEQALSMRVETVDKDHYSLANPYYNIGMVYSCKGELEKSLEYIGKAFSIAITKFDPEHPHPSLYMKSYMNILLASK